MLDERRVSYEVVEVDLITGEEQQQVLEEVEKLTGKKAFPVTVIDGRVIQGYKAEEITGALPGEA